MRHEYNIKVGDILTNVEVIEKFKCGNMGGMRRSKATNTLILISDKTKGLYQDIWDGDILYYTGMGKKGDQKLEGNQNKTLYESQRNGVGVHLFEVEVKNRYQYRGEVKLISDPYIAMQRDEDGNNRKVWIFPLKIVDRKANRINNNQDTDLIDQIGGLKEVDFPVKVRRVYKRKEKQEPAIVDGIKVHKRSKETAIRALAYANYLCEIDNSHPTFIRKNSDKTYTEPHHLIPMQYSDNFSASLDVEANIVSLCSNCHNQIHYGRDFNELLEKLYKDRIDFLRKVELDISYEELMKMYI